MAFSRLNIPRSVCENFDCDFQEFFFDVASKEIKFSHANVTLIKKALEELKDILNADRKEIAENLMYNSPLKRCAYMLKYGPCIASVFSLHLLELLSCNLSDLCKDGPERQMKICCLGGGPATEVIAFSKILSAVEEDDWSTVFDEFEQKIKLHVTIIDNNDGWENMAQNVVRTLKATPQIFDHVKMEIKLSFINADLTQSGNVEVLDAVKNADIVSMSFLLSACYKMVMKRMEPIEEIFWHMKEGALLFYLDSSSDLLYETMSSIAQLNNGIKQFYGPHLNQLHMLSFDSMKKHVELCGKIFSQIVCQPHCEVSVSVWTKTKNSTMTRSARSRSLSSVKEEKGKEVQKEKKKDEIRLTQKALDQKTREEHKRKIQLFQWKCKPLLPEKNSKNYNRKASLHSDKSKTGEYFQDLGCQEELDLAESFDNLYFQEKPKNRRRFT